MTPVATRGPSLLQTGLTRVKRQQGCSLFLLKRVPTIYTLVSGLCSKLNSIVPIVFTVDVVGWNVAADEHVL